MRHLLPVVAATVVCVSSVRAAPPADAPFSTKSFGDGGGYKHPDAAVGQYFETVPERKAEPKPEPSKPKPESTPAVSKPELKPAPVKPAVAERPSRPRPRPFAPVPAPETSTAPSRSGGEGTSLAKSESKETSPAGAPIMASAPNGAAANIVSTDDAASDDARRDYEARMFGAPSEARRPGLDESARPSSFELASAPAAGAGAAAAPVGEGMLFVSLELDAKEAGALRDAVAGLGAAASFRIDPRFQPLPGDAGSVRVSGWLPVSRLSDAISSPGVRSVAVERGSRPAANNRLTGAYVLKVRVVEGADSEAAAARKVRDATAAAGFQLERVLSIEPLTGGVANVLVSGTMPVSQLSRALGLPGVIDISPALPDASALEPELGAERTVPKEGFLKFVMARKLWLVLLTALLALPAFSAALKKALGVFVPYR